MRHTLTVDLTDQQEIGWAERLAFVNAERAADGRPTFADVDDFMVNNDDQSLATLGDYHFTQAKERKATEVKPFIDALIEKVIADPETKDRVTQAEALDVKVQFNDGGAIAGEAAVKG